MKFRGERLTAARLEAGYVTPEAFARAIGVSGQTVRTWEKGQYAPNEENLAKIVAETDRRVGYFYGEDGTETERCLEALRELLSSHPNESHTRSLGGMVHVLRVEGIAAGELTGEMIDVPSALLPDDVDPEECFLVELGAYTYLARRDLSRLTERRRVVIYENDDFRVLHALPDEESVLLLSDDLNDHRRVSREEVLGVVIWRLEWLT